MAGKFRGRKIRGSAGHSPGLPKIPSIRKLTFKEAKELKRIIERGLKASKHPAVAAAVKARQGFTKAVKQERASISKQIGGNFIKDVAKALSGQVGAGDVGSELLTAALGKDGADFTKSIAKYAKGGAKDELLDMLFKKLGPVGTGLKFLLGQTKEEPEQSTLEQAKALLEQAGYTVSKNVPAKATGGFSLGTSSTSVSGNVGGGTWVSAPQIGNQPESNQSDDFIPMQPVQSSNVRAIGYNPHTRTLRVQFLGSIINRSALSGHGHRSSNRVIGKLGKTLRGSRSGPGSTYDYFNVPQKVFNKIASAGSKGGAIWDNLRIRGTVYGHVFDYSLVEVSRQPVFSGTKRVGSVTYVPRKASGPGAFKSRTFFRGQQMFKSLLPTVGIKKGRISP